MFYKDKPWFNTLKFEDIFPDELTFTTLMEEFMNASEKLVILPLADVYRNLFLKYYTSHTRYTVPESFIFALIKELKMIWPIYTMQENLMKQAMELEIAEIMKVGVNLRNLVENPNEMNSAMDTVAITNTSSQQESYVTTGNKLQAIRNKYDAVMNDYQANFYKYLDRHFRQIISSDESLLYENEE